jgi:hypothetical protein
VPYYLPAPELVKIEVYNALNQLEFIRSEGRQPQGYHTCLLDLAACENGVYFYRLITENGLSTGKMIKQDK